MMDDYLNGHITADEANEIADGLSYPVPPVIQHNAVTVCRRYVEALARIASLEKQLAAQKAIVAADDARFSKFGLLRSHMSAGRDWIDQAAFCDSSQAACLDTRQAAEQLDKEDNDA